MFGTDGVGAALDIVAHVIQEALTPVFLLSGIATLLNVFSTRLARVADQVSAVGKALGEAAAAERSLLKGQLTNLYRSSVALDVAVVLAALGAAATCGAVLALFVSSFRERANAWVLFGLFAAGVVCALGGIVAFAAEMLMAGIVSAARWPIPASPPRTRKLRSRPAPTRHSSRRLDTGERRWLSDAFKLSSFSQMRIRISARSPPLKPRFRAGGGGIRVQVRPGQSPATRRGCALGGPSKCAVF